MKNKNNLPEISGLELSTEPSDLEHYGSDWTRFWAPTPRAIAFPRTTGQVAELVKWAREQRVPLVPSGGRTGLSGGAVAARGEVVVSLERMREMIELDPVDASITVEAGVTIGEVQRQAREAGLFYPVDWAAAGSSQAGGSVATNAGGIRVLRYGMTRRWVRGLTVVTGAGEVLELNRGLIKNNAGYDLRHLFIGSEGTLGIITQVTFGLLQPPPPQSVLLLEFSGLDAIMPAFTVLRECLDLSAFEMFDRACVAHVAERSGRDFPLAGEGPFLAVVEFDDPEGNRQEAAMKVFERLSEAGQVADGVISQSEAQARELWHWREAISESIAAHTPYKNDLSVRVSRVPDFLRELAELVESECPGFQVVWFGHIGDGNLHMNILRPHGWAVDRFMDQCENLSLKVFELVRRHGGSISAEHGVGLLKRDYLINHQGDAQWGAMAALKRAFDPDGIINPDKVLAALGRD